MKSILLPFSNIVFCSLIILLFPSVNLAQIVRNKTIENAKINELYRRDSPYVVTIYCYLSKESLIKKQYASYGSGVVISDKGHVLTNHHVVAKGAKYFEIMCSNRRYIAAKTPESYLSNDFVILKSEYILKNRIPISLNIPKLGDRVFSLGSPLDYKGTISDGYISAPLQKVNGKLLIQHNSSIAKGSSGGPLVNEFGDLIGINVKMTKTGKLSFAIPINFIRKTIVDKTIFNEVEIQRKEAIKNVKNAFIAGKDSLAVALGTKFLINDTSIDIRLIMGQAYLNMDNLDNAFSFLNKLKNEMNEKANNDNHFLSSLYTGLATFYWKKTLSLKLFSFYETDSSYILCSKTHSYYDSVISKGVIARQFDSKNIQANLLLSKSYAANIASKKAFYYAEEALSIDNNDAEVYLAKAEASISAKYETYTQEAEDPSHLNAKLTQNERELIHNAYDKTRTEFKEAAQNDLSRAKERINKISLLKRRHLVQNEINDVNEELSKN